MIRRGFDVEFRSVERDEDKGTATIYGVALPFNKTATITDKYGEKFHEQIENSALDSTELRDVRFLVNHEMNKIPVARSRNNNANSTLRLSVDPDGLKYEADLDIRNNSDSRALVSAIERGDITGMSFGMKVGKDNWGVSPEGIATRSIESIDKLVEISAVTFPAYEDTEIAVRDCRPDKTSGVETPKGVLDSAQSSLDSELELIKIKAQALNKRR